MKGKKWLKILLAAVAFVAALAAALFVSQPEMEIRLFRGVRITGVSSIKVNDIKYEPREKYIEFDGERQPLTTKKNVIEIEGGKEGIYDVIFMLDNAELARLTDDSRFLELEGTTPLVFSYNNQNWWNIARLSLKTDLEEENGKWVAKIEAQFTEQQEDGSDAVKYRRTATVDYFAAAQNDGEIRIELKS